MQHHQPTTSTKYLEWTNAWLSFLFILYTRDPFKKWKTKYLANIFPDIRPSCHYHVSVRAHIFCQALRAYWNSNIKRKWTFQVLYSPALLETSMKHCRRKRLVLRVRAPEYPTNPTQSKGQTSWKTKHCSLQSWRKECQRAQKTHSFRFLICERHRQISTEWCLSIMPTQMATEDVTISLTQAILTSLIQPQTDLPMQKKRSRASERWPLQRNICFVEFLPTCAPGSQSCPSKYWCVRMN